MDYGSNGSHLKIYGVALGTARTLQQMLHGQSKYYGHGGQRNLPSQMMTLMV